MEFGLKGKNGIDLTCMLPWGEKISRMSSSENNLLQTTKSRELGGLLVS